MAQPPFITSGPKTSYVSPPRRPGQWRSERPGDEAATLPGKGLGSQGPDQGYILKLAKHLEPKMVLQDGEHRADVVAGCAAVAMKRASLFGRAPVLDDLQIAMGIFGFFSENPPDDLVDARRKMFAEVSHVHHYTEQRAIADSVSAELLHQSHADISEATKGGWRSIISVEG